MSFCALNDSSFWQNWDFPRLLGLPNMGHTYVFEWKLNTSGKHLSAVGIRECICKIVKSWLMRLLHLRQVLSNGLHGGTSATGLKQRMKYKIEIRMREYTFSFNPTQSNQNCYSPAQTQSWNVQIYAVNYKNCDLKI